MRSTQDFFRHPALVGLQVNWGFRQSIPSSMQAIWDAEIETTPSLAEGQTNFPRSNLFAYRESPTPSCQRIFARSPRRPLKM
jgi:hypothetical protein